jgi:hypothetical protein
MGLPKKRSIALQGTLWTILRLAHAQKHGNETKVLRRTEEGLEDGTVALVIICLILIFLTILAIAFHYCNFKGNEKYEKLERENELVEVDLYESDN